MTILLEKEDKMGFSPGELELIGSAIQDNNVVFDVGAATGGWTKEVLKRFPDTTIHLFEPTPKICQSLKQDFDALIETGQITVNCCAVSEVETTRQFCFYPDHPRLSTFYRRNTDIEKEIGKMEPEFFDVSTITLDNYCEQKEIEYIHFLKIDVEGAELDVIKGASKLLTESRIKYLQFEYGGCFLDAGIKLQDVFEFLIPRHYKTMRILEEGLSRFDRFSPSLENYRWNNFLAVSER